MFTDTHCHVYKGYYDDIDEVISNANELGVNRLINNGCDRNSNREVIEIINKYNNIYSAIGIHPESVDDYSLDDLEFIRNNLGNEKIIAIGEIGLDYHYTKENREEQIKLFEAQLRMAQENDMPVVIHSREATEDTLRILKKYKLKGVIHSFSGSLETALEYIKLGYLIGINGVVTFKNCKLKDILANIPLESIILETDSPYLTPEPYRGHKNEPGNVRYVAEFVAKIYNIELSKLAEITNSNISRIFDI